jgi:hypothetical protein
MDILVSNVHLTCTIINGAPCLYPISAKYLYPINFVIPLYGELFMSKRNPQIGDYYKYTFYYDRGYTIERIVDIELRSGGRWYAVTEIVESTNPLFTMCSKSELRSDYAPNIEYFPVYDTPLYDAIVGVSNEPPPVDEDEDL